MIGIPEQKEIDEALVLLFSKNDDILFSPKDNKTFWVGEWVSAYSYGVDYAHSDGSLGDIHYDHEDAVDSLTKMRLFDSPSFNIREDNNKFVVSQEEYDFKNKKSSTKEYILQIKKERTEARPNYGYPHETISINYPFEYKGSWRRINIVFDDIIFLGDHGWYRYPQRIFLPFTGNFLVKKSSVEKYITLMDISKKVAVEMNKMMLKNGVALDSIDPSLKNIPIINFFPFCVSLDTYNKTIEEIIYNAVEKEILSEEMFVKIFTEYAKKRVRLIGLQLPVVKIIFNGIFLKTLKKMTQNNAFDPILINIVQTIKIKKNLPQLLTTLMQNRKNGGSKIYYYPR